MQFTEMEARYLDCLAKEMTFAEMAVELGMTVEEVDAFGTSSTCRSARRRNAKQPHRGSRNGRR